MSFVQVKRWLREPVASLGATPRSALLWAHFNPFDGGILPDDEARQSALCARLAEYAGFWDGLPTGLTAAGLVHAFALAADLRSWGFVASAGERDGGRDGGSEIGFHDWLQLALARPRRREQAFENV